MRHSKNPSTWDCAASVAISDSPTLSFQGKDAKLFKTFDNPADHIQDGDDDEVMMKDKETKRSLYSKDTKKDFGEISLELAKIYVS